MGLGPISAHAEPSGDFCQQPLKTSIIEHRISQQTLQFRVLGLLVLQPPQLRHSHAAILGFPLVQRRIRHAVLAAKLRNLRSGAMFLKNLDDLAQGLRGPITTQ